MCRNTNLSCAFLRSYAERQGIEDTVTPRLDLWRDSRVDGQHGLFLGPL